MNDTTRTEKVRLAVVELGENITRESIADKIGIQTYRDRRLVGDLLYDLYRSGEIERVERGVYRYVGKRQKASKEYLMWRRLRKNGATLKELMVFSGAAEEYVREWLRTLVRSGLVVQQGEVFRLIKDQVEMPKNDDKAERLRELRARRKDALTAVREARAALDRVENMLQEE